MKRYESKPRNQKFRRGATRRIRKEKEEKKGFEADDASRKKDNKRWRCTERHEKKREVIGFPGACDGVESVSVLQKNRKTESSEIQKNRKTEKQKSRKAESSET